MVEDLAYTKLEIVNQWFDSLTRSHLISYYLYKETGVILSFILTPQTFPMVQILQTTFDQSTKLTSVDLSVLDTWLFQYAKQAYGVEVPDMPNIPIDAKVHMAVMKRLGL